MVFRLLVATLAGAGIAACARDTSIVPPACATMPQAPVWDPATDAGVQAIVQYAGTLAYESQAHPTGDRRPLTVIVQRGAQPGGNRYRLANQPPEGTAEWGIAPQSCAHLFEPADLGPAGATSGVGEVVGYIESPRPYLKPPRGPGPVPDCTTAPGRCRQVLPQAGRVFIWVDSLDGNGARALLIPDNATSPNAIIRVNVTYVPNPDTLAARTFPEARWLFDADDDDAWIACAKTGCCVVELDP